MPESSNRTEEARLTEEELLALSEGSVVITHGIAWAKIGPDLWRSPFRKHVADMSISPANQRFSWHDEKDSRWLAEVATEVIFDYRAWEARA